MWTGQPSRPTARQNPSSKEVDLSLLLIQSEQILSFLSFEIFNFILDQKKNYYFPMISIEANLNVSSNFAIYQGSNVQEFKPKDMPIQFEFCKSAPDRLLLSGGVILDQETLSRPEQVVDWLQEITLTSFGQNLTFSTRYLQSMQQARIGHKIFYYHNRLFAVGGNQFDQYFKSLEVYDFDTNEWTEKAEMATARSRFSGFLYISSIFVMGGFSSYSENSSKLMERYDIASDT